MKKILILLILIALTIPAFAEEEITFKDLPERHWAAQAIYDLVKMGVTQGYPDGTFRGEKKVSRYELAAFLSKLARALGGGELRDLREDIRALKKEILAMRRGKGAGGITGSYEMAGKAGNLMAKQTTATGVGPVASYRLQTTLARSLAKDTEVKVNLDTMDSGFYGGARDLALEMIDVETKVKTDVGVPLEVSASIGPGPIQHIDATGVLSSESGIYYQRPRTGVAVATKLYDTEVEGKYVVRSRSTNQDVETSHLTGKLGLNVPILPGLKMDLSADYLTRNLLSSNKITDIRGAIAVSKELAPKIKSSAMWGMGGRERSSWMAGATVTLEDALNTGTDITFKLARVGSQYLITTLSEEDLAGYDVFDRPLGNSATYIGAELAQAVTSDIKIKGKGDIRTNNQQYTLEGGIGYDIAPYTEFDLTYRLHKDPLTADITDITALGLQYKF